MSANKNISLFIPRVFANFDKEYVVNAFEQIGEVSDVDFVAKQDKNGKFYNAVYVHFNKWHSTKKAQDFYNKVVDETQEARLLHDDPWYWIVLPNIAKKHIPGQRKPRIVLGEETITKSIIAPTLPVTPRASVSEVCPGAPAKRNYVDAVAKQTKREFNDEFDAVAAAVAAAEEEFEMDKIESLFEEEDANLISIDGRYVQQIEAENWGMTQEIMHLRAALINLDQMYRAESAKVTAFIKSVDL